MKLYGNLKLHGGELQNLKLEVLTDDPTGIGLFEGRLWYNSTADAIKYYDGADVQIVGDTAELQTVINNLNTEITARQNADTTLQANIDAEETARVAADATLTSNLAAEVTNRQNADSTLQSNINTVQSNLNTEATTRQNADTTLQANIDAEATTRAAADTTLTNNLNAEITARQNADSTLQANIDAEATARAAADSTLTSNLAAEVTNRQNADSTLQANIDTEATARAAADTTLTNSLDAEATARANADTTLQANIDNEVSARTAAVALKVSKSGDSMSGNLAMGGVAKVTGMVAPTDPTDAATKAYVDSLASGLVWRDPIVLINFTGSASAPVASPVKYDSYVIDVGGATGAWAGFAEGDVVQCTDEAGPVWTKVTDFTVGQHYVISGITETTPIGIAAGHLTDYMTVTNAVPGSYAATFDEPIEGNAVFVGDPGAALFGRSYTYAASTAAPTGNPTHTWIQFGGPGATGAGVGLYYEGNVLHVNLGAGIAQLPTDEVGIDLYATGGLELVDPGTGLPSNASDAVLAINAADTSITVDGNGIKLATTLQTAISSNTSAIAAETTARQNADTTLQANIDAEATARIAADSTLQANIDAEATTRAAADTTLTNNLNAEITARQNADSTLQANIDAEVTARTGADTTLTNNLNAEITARTNADTTLQANIDAEATARANADTTLTNNLNAEITARTNADTTLQANIDAEATARANADTTLQANIDAEATARANADTTLQTNIDACAKRYQFTAGAANTSFTINHNLGYKYVNVTVYDSVDDEVIIPNSIQAISTNSLTITFTSAVQPIVKIVA